MHRTTTQCSQRRAARWIAGITMALTAGAAIGASVVEFYNTNLDTYFITADPIEAAAVDGGAAGPGWLRTGASFNAGGPTPVCRFYGSLAPGPNSHFYTAVAEECAALKQLQATTPPSQKRWNFESLDFATTVPAGGVCAADARAVYRAYNNGFSRGVDSNHRITTSVAGIEQVVARGWNNEGVVMCAPSAVPQAGWWSNPAENGRWFFLESGNIDTQLAGYFYTADGRATWLSSVGPNADPYTYGGRLLDYRDGQTLLGTYKPPAAPTDAGAVTLTFADDTHAGLAWPGGAVPLERAHFGTGDAPFQPHTGWWSNPDESGRAYSIEVQGDSLFAGAYMYDTAGNPVWYYSSGKMATPTTYEGQWLQSANGQTLAGPWQPPGAPIAVSDLSIEFTAIDEASLTFTGDAAANAAAAQPKSRVRIFTPVKPTRPVKPGPLPARFDGSFTQSIFDQHLASGTTSTITSTVTGNLTWRLDTSELTRLPELKSPQAFYIPTGSEKPLTLDYVVKTVGNGATCNGKVEGLQLALPSSNSTLEVNGYGKFVLKLKFTVSTGTFVTTCQDENSVFTSQFFGLVPITFEFEKAMVYGVTGGGRSETSGADGHTIVTTSFSFAAVSAN